MSSAESKAKSIILAELGEGYGVSYQRLRELCWTGYTHLYLQNILVEAGNLSELKTTAKLSVVLELAKHDLVGIEFF